MISIFSYRDEYVRRCPSGCCVEARGSSSFQIYVAKDPEDAASYLAKRLFADRSAKYVNIVLHRLEGLSADLGRQVYLRADEGVDSLCFPQSDGCDDWDENERILDSTRARLEALVREAEEQERLQEAEETRKRQADREAREQRLLLELQAKYPETTPESEGV